MSSASAGSPSAAKLPAQDKFSCEKSVIGGVTLLAMHGTLNEGFEGRKLADSIKTKSVVIDMREVRRLASWGMSEWMDFLKRLDQRDVYITECSTYAVSQLNLVTGLLGQAKLVSFYAAYRCGNCNTPGESQIVIPRDRDVIPELPSSAIECAKCKGAAHIEEYPAAFFETVATRDAFDIADDVLALFRSRFKYDLAADITRFRAFSATQGNNTYVRISGRIAPKSIDKVVEACRNNTVLDLEQVIFNPADIEPWRMLIGGALAQVKGMQLLHCPAGFMSWVIEVRQLTEKLKARSCTDSTACDARRRRCRSSTSPRTSNSSSWACCRRRAAGVATAPSRRSPRPISTRGSACYQRATAIRSSRSSSPSRARCRRRSSRTSSLESSAKPPRRRVAAGGSCSAASSRSRSWAGSVGSRSIRGEDRTSSEWSSRRLDAGPSKPAPPSRPEWITAEAPASSYCHDMINRLICVGISPFRTNREAAEAEANDAALEELVHTVGLRISDDFFKQQVANHYAEARSKLLSALYAVETDRKGEPYAKALETVTAARKRVVDALRTSAVAAVPPKRTDWHWEEYAGEPGKPNEQLVFVLYDVGLDTVRALVDKYSSHVKAKGATFVTTFPGISWEYAIPMTGGMVVKAARWLPVEPTKIIQAAGGTALIDAVQLGKFLEEAHSKPVELTVAGPQGAAQLSVRP
jgi:hypothetical protein